MGDHKSKQIKKFTKQIYFHIQPWEVQHNFKGSGLKQVKKASFVEFL